MKSKLKMPGISVDTNKKFDEAELTYEFQSDDDVCGFGRLITTDAANVLIHAYKEHKLKYKDEKQPRAVTFGKEALLHILAQKGCEGIRFYFGKRSKAQWEKECKYSKFEGITLVAVGVDADNKDLGTNGSSITSEMKTAKLSEEQTTQIYEVVPPDPDPDPLG